MGKYIITFEDYPQMKEDGVKFYSCNEAPWWYASEQIISKLTPYTEPDTEQVREDAFKNGYDAACKDIDVKSKTNAAYRKGLEDAWEAARKIIHMPEGDLLNLFTECYSAVCTSVQVFLKYDASEAIEKIRQYEQKKEEQIRVGDEVITGAGKAVVVGVGPVHFEYVYADSTTGFGKVGNVKKTGRHFPEIAEVLKKIKGEEE